MSENKKDNKFVGNLGEEIAVKYLTSRGYSVVGQNYLKKWGEIDIIARKGKNYHFVEVKTVSRQFKDFDNDDGYKPEDNVHPWKIKRLNRAIESYLMEKGIDEDTDWQLDLISIYLDLEKKKAKVEMLENIS